MVRYATHNWKGHALMSPRLSVIVPIYNVEQYLAACLDSLAVQTVRDLEVVMVDDGSGDGSAALAAGYAERDSRFRLVTKENAGLGAARNTGLQHLSPDSEFVAFVDSDDMVPPDAYRIMLASLDESGSDLVTGNVRNVNSTKVWQSSMHRFLAGKAVRGTHVTRNLRLLSDRTAWNKVYRRSFWDRHGFTFPEGILYEDGPVTIPLHFLAESVDIVAESIYYWRLREGESSPSITQRRTEPKAVRDRAASVRMISGFLAGQPGPEAARLKLIYDRTVLEDDLRIFLSVLPDTDEEFRAEFLKAANGFLDQVDPKVVRELPAPARVKWLLVRKHAMAELVDLITEERRGGRMELEGLLRKYASFPMPEGGSLGHLIPRRARRIDPDLKIHAPLQDIAWVDGKLRLSGHAWIDRLDQPTRRSAVKVLQLRKEGSRRRVVTRLRNTYSPERTVLSPHKEHNYDWAGWELVLDPARLRQGDRYQEATWHLGLGILSSGIVRRSAVESSGATRANNPPYSWLDADFRLLPRVVKGVLTLRVEKVGVLITGHRLDGEAVEVDGEIRRALPRGATVALQVANNKSGEVFSYPAVLEDTADGRTPFRVRVPLKDVALLPELQDAGAAGAAAADTAPVGRSVQRAWSTALLVTDAEGTTTRCSTVVRDGLADLQIRLPGSFGEGADRNEVALLAGSNGYLKFVGRPVQARITELSWSADEGAYVVRGSTPADLVDPVFVLRARDRFEERTLDLTSHQDGTFEARFRPSAMPGANGALPLRSGRWNVLLRSAASGTDIPMVVDRLAEPAFPVHGEHGGRAYDFEARWYDYPQLMCQPDLTLQEQGSFHKDRLLREVYQEGRRKPLRDAVLYISYNGRQFSDSPRFIHEEFVRRGVDVEHLWAVRDGQLELPPTVTAVRFGSADWWDALARCRYVVTNAHLPDAVERREGQVIVQTWHGTMLKRIGLDVEAPKFDLDYHYRLRREAGNWSMLVSANRFSTPILQRAMGYDGPIIETGYPRNDRLYAADREARAKEVRTRLGLPDGKRVVLYAPTWRDDLQHSRGMFKFDMRLDTEDARTRLGEDHVLLVRRHSNIVDSVPGAGNGFVFDVSEYPDIVDLYLVADILVTDYSSVMFDFAHLKRPMLFFTYDLEHYRDTLRGFYFSFEQEAPGPLIHTSPELVDAIRDIDRVSGQYAERYARFQELFCDLDDGGASARVVDRILQQGATGA